MCHLLTSTRLPYLSVKVSVTREVSTLLGFKLENTHKRAVDVLNIPCFVVGRNPTVAANVGELAITFFVFLEEATLVRNDMDEMIAAAIANREFQQIWREASERTLQLHISSVPA